MPLNFFSHLAGITIDEVLHQQRNIFFSLAQRPDLDGKHLKPIEEIAPKRLIDHGSTQVAISRSNHPNIGADGLSSTDTLEFPLLENAQKSTLHFRRKLADLVEEDRPSFGELKSAEPPLQSTCKCSLLMAKQFRPKQGLPESLRNSQLTKALAARCERL